MNSKLAVLCGIVGLSITGIASAGQATGFYLGGSLGTSEIDVSTAPLNFSDKDQGYKVFGGYNFGLLPLLDLGIEGSYVDLGKASSVQILNQDVDITAWDLFGVAAVNIGPIGVFGKIGEAWWESKSDVFKSVLDTSGNDTVYGIGLRFQLGSLALRAEYERFEIDVADVDYVSAGVSWTF